MFKTPLLMVHDDPAMTALGTSLSDEFDVQVLQSPEEALAVLPHVARRLVFLDLEQASHATSEQGFRLLQSIQREGRYKTIVCTRYSERDLAVRAVRYGAYDVLYKPVDLNVLRGVLRRAGWVAELEQGLDGASVGDGAERTLETLSAHQAVCEAVPGNPAEHGHSISLKLNQQRIETDLIMKAFTLFHGNLSRAAQELGISRSTLYRRIRQYGLERAAAPRSFDGAV